MPSSALGNKTRHGDDDAAGIQFPGDPIGGEAFAAAARHDEFTALCPFDDVVMMPVLHRAHLVRARFRGFQHLGFVFEVCAQSGEEISIKPLPHIQRTESNAFLILEHMGDALGGGADDAKRKSATHAKGETREGGNLAPSQGLIGVMSILALDGPVLAVVGQCDQINTLIGDGQLEFLRDGLRHFAVQPNVLEFAGILGFQEQVGFDELLEYVALLLFRELAQPSLNVRP